MASPEDAVGDCRVPMTLLSGFPGAGKTTLLNHILRNTDNMRVCVIVKDIASLNLDASLVKNAELGQAGERLVEMQNGCICCPLREDLVKEMGALARAGRFDCIAIESPGSAEPHQTAETFTMERTDEIGSAALHEVARLDTCVTVVDAAELLSNATSEETLAQRGVAATQDDDRNVAELLLDQMEFADVILLNKTDLVPADQLHRMLAFIKTLNPRAAIVPTARSKVDLSKVLDTGKFSFDKASRSAGWLRSSLLQAETSHTSGAVERGAGAFVYRSRRPFHPGRLHCFMAEHFLLQEPDWREESEEESEEGDVMVAGSRGRDASGLAKAAQTSAAAADAAQQTVAALQGLSMKNSGEVAPLLAAATAAAKAALSASSAVALLLSQLPGGHTPAQHVHQDGCSHRRESQSLEKFDEASAAERKNRLHSSFGQVLRAKGFVWLATRPQLGGDWSQAGGVVRFTVGDPWYAALPAEAWPQDPAQRAEIRRDFQGLQGDRRQELAFIGIDVNEAALAAALDACLLREGEAPGGDPFAAWPTLQHILDGGDDEEGEEAQGTVVDDREESEEEEEASPLPPPGSVLAVEDGAAQLQAALDALEPGSMAIVHWHAPWVGQSVAASAALEALVAANPGALAARVDVERTTANRVLAMEKVMERASAKRQGVKPVLRAGLRFPAFSVHHAPSLQPTTLIDGSESLKQVGALLKEAAASFDPVAAAESRGGRKKALAVLSAGAADLKVQLAAGRDIGAPVVVVWTSIAASAVGHKAMQAAAAAAARAAGSAAVVVLADVEASKANTVLAEALHVRILPALHVYRNMKLESKKIGAAEATPAAVLEAALSSAATPAAPRPPSKPTAPGAAAKTVTFAPAPSPAAPAVKQASGAAAAPRPPSAFDPPTGKFARPGATQSMQDGSTGHFFPKMPCLRCGCPWWTSDEWHASCCRCGWDCERQGYDDDSRPLPAHVKKWEGFVAAIKEGRVPEWRGK